MSRRSLILPLVVALAAAVALVAVLVGGGDGSDGGRDSGPAAQGPTDSSGAPQEQQSAGEPVLEKREEGDPLAMGPVDAPVVMVMWSDFQCPFCGRFARETLPELVERYVDAGELRVEWRDFAYLGKESREAAKVARVAAEQGRFWEFHDALFADQPKPNTGGVDRAHLEDAAREAGLDLDRFRAGLAEDAHHDVVQADFDEGAGIGVTGTPSFLINNRPVVGAQPAEAFITVVDEALAAAR